MKILFFFFFFFYKLLLLFINKLASYVKIINVELFSAYLTTNAELL